VTVDDLRILYDYGYWANGRLFEAISKLSSEQFTQEIGVGHGSIRNTLVHTMSAEWGWLARCGGEARTSRLEPNDFPDLDSIRDTWDKVESYVREFLSQLRDEDLDRFAVYMNPRGEQRSMPVGELMQHAANHGIHHRAQVAIMLRLLGAAAVNVDLLFYYSEKRGVPAW